MRTWASAWLLSFLVVLSVACATQVESTPRPTYTPYATFTPAPTATLQPIYTPYPTFTPVLAPSPPTSMTASTTEYFESEIFEEYFRGRTQDAVERGIAEFEAGAFGDAIVSFKEAQRHHGRPSGVLENRIALAYQFWQRYYLAIEHYSNAIAIRDSTVNRVNRSQSYVEIGQCSLAITDAQVALTMEPDIHPGLHTDVEANIVLATCYEYAANYMAALQHLEAAIAIAEEHQYDEALIADGRLWRDALKQAIE